MHGRGMTRVQSEVAGSGLTRYEAVFVVLALGLFAVLALAGSGFIQPYDNGVQVGYVFIDWHYLVNSDARVELRP